MNGLGLSPKKPRDSRQRRSLLISHPQPLGCPTGNPKELRGPKGLGLGTKGIISAAALFIWGDLISSEVWCLERNTSCPKKWERGVGWAPGQGDHVELKGRGRDAHPLQRAAAQQVVTDAQVTAVRCTGEPRGSPRRRPWPWERSLRWPGETTAGGTGF